MPARRFTITGRVQKVGYRWWAVGEARRLGLSGWVRNRTDGSVEIVAAGDLGRLQAFAAACGRGPAAAQVAHVEESVIEPSDRATADLPLPFEQRPTA